MISPVRGFLLLEGRSLPLLRSSRIIKAARGARSKELVCRNASESTVKPIRLEKPAKFVPPSHGKRLRQQVPRHYGPELTKTQKTEQATKKYPNMMPAPGTFMFWFLTSRGLHSFITLGTLVLLAAFTAYENWKRDTAFKEQLPSAGEFLSHPLASCSQAIEVFKLDVARTSAETAEKRKRDVEDVQKRSSYRRAHGLENEDSQGLGGWTARSDEETMGPSLKVDGPVPKKPISAVPVTSAEDSTEAGTVKSKDSTYVDWEGTKKPIKKWFGIW